MQTVYCVIVSFRPCFDSLATLCRVLAASHASVVIVDNGDTAELAAKLPASGCTLISLRRNTGIAYAQNVGILHAISRGAQIIVFFDQDTVVDCGFLEALLAPLRLGLPDVVAPIGYDFRQGHEYPGLRLGRFGLPVKTYSRQAALPNPVDIVISSGTAATVQTFGLAGLMDESLFIDFVDTEWSLRCRANGVPIRIVPTAAMRHSIGADSVAIGRCRVVLHSPTRSYYQIRNSLLLFRRDSVPFAFALWAVFSVFLHKLLMLLFVSNRWRYFRNYLMGVWHGCRGLAFVRPTLGG